MKNPFCTLCQVYNLGNCLILLIGTNWTCLRVTIFKHRARGRKINLKKKRSVLYFICGAKLHTSKRVISFSRSL